MGNYNQRITNASDEGYAVAETSSFNNAVNPQLGVVAAGAPWGRLRNYAWFRFPNVTIPQGADVHRAYIMFKTTNRSTSPYGDIYSNIYAVDEDNHAAPTSFSEWNTDHGLHTTASVAWGPFAAWGTVGIGLRFKTPNIAPVIDEVVKRGGWSSGNAIGIHIEGDPTAQTENHWCEVEDVENSGTSAARLYIEWGEDHFIEVHGDIELPTYQEHVSPDDGYDTESAINYTNTLTLAGRQNANYLTGLLGFICHAPQGATIDSAFVRFLTVSAAGAGNTVDIDIFGLKKDDHTSPTTHAEVVTDHGLHTTASAHWTFVANNTAGVTQDTPDISAVIQEIVDRPGWAPGNTLGLHIEGVSPTPSLTFQRWQTYETNFFSDGKVELELYIQWSLTGPIQLAGSGKAAAQGEGDLTILGQPSTTLIGWGIPIGA
jgi:type IV pilus assembly protein PilY1